MAEEKSPPPPRNSHETNSAFFLNCASENVAPSRNTAPRPIASPNFVSALKITFRKTASSAKSALTNVATASNLASEKSLHDINRAFSKLVVPLNSAPQKQTGDAKLLP